MKVEQRIGRLDRIGQKKTVFIYNLACAGTIEERVLSVLDQRIQLFTESVGSLDPILGEVETQLASIVMGQLDRSEEHTSELQSLMRISYAVFCLKKKNNNAIKE